MNQMFRTWAAAVTRAVGHSATFFAACALLVVWAICGPFFHYSEIWQLVVNTATSIITFLIVILIQNGQNRDTVAMHLKLDELLRAVGPAKTEMVKLENLSDDQLDQLQKEFEAIRVNKAPKRVRAGNETKRRK